MPFFKLKRSKQKYNVLSKNTYVACVHLLDGSVMECTLQSESSAQECLDSVLQRMEVAQPSFFSLKFLNKLNQLVWIELDKPLKKQLDKNAADCLLHFGLMFYIPEPHKVVDEMSRYQLFLQLRSDILDGRLPCSPEQAVRLAAYSLQVEFGDHVFDQQTPDYFGEFPLFPRSLAGDEHQLAHLTQEVLALHNNIRGMSPTVAEIQYLHEVEKLDGYGYEYYNAKDDGGNTVVVGTCHDGFFIKSLTEQTAAFMKWQDIKSLGTNKKCLVVRTTHKEQPFNIVLDDPEMAKYVWRQFVAQRRFSLNLQSDMTEPTAPDGSTGAIPDIQQSVQSLEESKDNENHTSSVQYTTENSEPNLPAGSEMFYPHPPLAQDDDLNAGLHQQEPSVMDNAYSLSQPAVSHTPSGSYEERQAALPAYRPSPDYHMVMQQRLAQQQAVAHQPPIIPPPVLPQRTIAMTEHVISSSQPSSLSDQERGKLGQAEPLYANLDQYQLMRKTGQNVESDYANLNTFAPSVDGLMPARPVDRSSSLIIQPTFDSAELPPRTVCPSHYNSENMISEVLLSDYKPPPPYTRGSNSTPDLASQTAQHNKQRSDSPDLISRKNLAPVNQGIYRSLDNLASIGHDHIGHDDDVSSDKSDATFHAKDSDHEEEATPSESAFDNAELNPNSVEAQMIRNYLASGFGYANSPAPVYFSSQSVNNPEFAAPSIVTQSWNVPQQPMQSRDRSFSDTQVSYAGASTTVTSSLSSIPQTIVVPPAVEMTASQESVASVIRMTASQECVKTAVYHSELSNLKSSEDSLSQSDSLHHAAEAAAESGHVETHGNDSVGNAPATCEIQNDSQQLCEQQLGEQQESQLSLEQQSKPQSSDQYDGLQQSCEQRLPSTQPKLKEEADQKDLTGVAEPGNSADSCMKDGEAAAQSLDETDAEARLREQIAAVKLRKPGPLKMAAMNGLVVSRTSIMLQQNDESRAPKDDRRGILETKLEEGQVFHEYQQIPRKPAQYDCTTGALAENEDKNRFKDVVPYEHNRVQLKPKKKNKQGYINASHIKLTVGTNEYWYIATQAPLENTVTDFWQMIWEQRTLVIAMMMELDTSGKCKCATYWPQKPGAKHKLTFGDFQVVLQFTNSSMCYVTNTLILIHKPSRQQRTIWHLQYTDWPEHGCPEDVYGFLSFLDEIESVQRHDSFDDGLKRPVVVHCSAGVGRTGVVILCELMKNSLEYNQPVDIPAVLGTLRDQRMHMVQTVGQYSFIYDSLITYLKNSRLI